MNSRVDGPIERGKSWTSRPQYVSEVNGPWHTETIEIDEPHANEVRVKMAFSGLCHSDEHLRTGALGARTGDLWNSSPDARRCTRSSAATRAPASSTPSGEGVTSVKVGRPRRDLVHPVVWQVRVLRLGASLHLRHGGRHPRRPDDLGRHVAPPPR